jgi:hypothetical protein
VTPYDLAHSDQSFLLYDVMSSIKAHVQPIECFMQRKALLAGPWRVSEKPTFFSC